MIDWTDDETRHCDQPEDQYTMEETEEMVMKARIEKELREHCQNVAWLIGVPYQEVRDAVDKMAARHSTIGQIFDGFRDIFGTPKKDLDKS